MRLEELPKIYGPETLSLMEALSTWSDQMLAMENSLLKRLVKLGTKLQALLKAA